jgi:hypothetical protein
MIDPERICREAFDPEWIRCGSVQAKPHLYIDLEGDDARALLVRLCNAVLEEAAKVAEAQKNPAPRYDVNRASNQGIDAAVAAIRALRVPENQKE